MHPRIFASFSCFFWIFAMMSGFVILSATPDKLDSRYNELCTVFKTLHVRRSPMSQTFTTPVVAVAAAGEQACFLGQRALAAESGTADLHEASGPCPHHS